MDAQASATGNPNDPRWGKASDSQSVAARTDGSDPAEQAELRLLTTLRQYNDPNRLKEQGIEMAKASPEMAAGPYYAAWGEYLSGNKKGAMEWLAEASRRAPGDPRAAATMAKMAKGEASPFEGHLSFSQDPSSY